ncbi:MAG: DNA translocase FtsK [Patescibacteria group bacterium]
MRYIYLVKAGEDQYKIGVSRNVAKRIAALQTSNIHLVELVCAKKTIDDSSIEKRLHKKMREFSGTGGKEWFHLTASQAIEIAIEISKAPEVDVAENIVQDLKKQIQTIIDTYESKIADERRQLDEDRKAYFIQRTKIPVKAASVPDREAERQKADERDYELAKAIVLEHQHVSTSFLQRHMRIGYGKAARFVERMEKDGLISPLDGMHRSVL